MAELEEQIPFEPDLLNVKSDSDSWRNLKSNFEHFGALRASARRK